MKFLNKILKFVVSTNTENLSSSTSNIPIFYDSNNPKDRDCIECYMKYVRDKDAILTDAVRRIYRETGNPIAREAIEKTLRRINEYENSLNKVLDLYRKYEREAGDESEV
jgi:hypothetical protein